jgi:hypothetical protein
VVYAEDAISPGYYPKTINSRFMKVVPVANILLVALLRPTILILS